MENEINNAGDYLGNLVSQFIDWIPNLLGALLIIFIGYLVAKAVAAGLHNLLGRMQLNQQVHSGAGGNVIQKAVPNPMGLIASITYWVIFLFAISIAVSVLGIPLLADIVQGIYSYIPNVLAALLIFLVASAVAGAVVTLVTNTMGDTPTGKVLATAAPIVIMSIAGFMILTELKIAESIVFITYALLLGSAALGMALAFGLGGREVAGKMLGNMYDQSQKNKGRIASDFKKGKERAQQKGNEMKNKNS